MVVYISIGNSDDKLTRQEWSLFFSQTSFLLQRHVRVHGQWVSEPASAWQNACWCVEVADVTVAEYIRSKLIRLAEDFRQDSIAWAEAPVTEFLTSAAVANVR